RNEDLRRPGFDVARLSVQWHVKIAYPLIAPVSMLLAIPFAFLVGARGAIGGGAIGVAIGIGYWSIARLMEAMGGVGQLPPFLAAWSPDFIFFFIGLYFFLKIVGAPQECRRADNSSNTFSFRILGSRCSTPLLTRPTTGTSSKIG